MFVGVGPLRAAIEKRLENARPLLSNVELIGQVEDVAAILHNSHFLFLVSAREGLSNALLEAVAAGVLPIITMTSGTADVIPFSDYPLFVRGDGEQHIRSAMQEALSMNPDDWISWSERLQRHIQQAFGLTEIAKRYSELYRDLGMGSIADPFRITEPRYEDCNAIDQDDMTSDTIATGEYGSMKEVGVGSR
jgi:L-malate glycosyltransferase